MSSTNSNLFTHSHDELEVDFTPLKAIIDDPKGSFLNEFYIPRVPEANKAALNTLDSSTKDHWSTKSAQSSIARSISHTINPSNSELERCMEGMEIPYNRYSGVLYAARFFVTRVGFLRSVKRIMVLSSHHMTIIDPYADDIKERYAYDDIKEITVAPDGTAGGSAGRNVDRSFTIFLAKNVKETYTSRARQQLLSAYYQIRERASSSSAAATIGIGMESSKASNINQTGDHGTVQASTSTNSTTGGMYFDNLFQLCGKTFVMVKLSTTQSTLSEPIKVQVLLAVRAASLDRLDTDTRATVSSILLIDVVKIQRVTTNSNELLIYYENNRVHRYWSDARESFIQAIGNNLRSWLGISLFVEEVSDLCEFDAISATRDIPQPVAFEVPVLKISKNKAKKFQFRWLAITSNAVVERAVTTRRTLASHPLSDIYNIVMYPAFSSAMNKQIEDGDLECEQNTESQYDGSGATTTPSETSSASASAIPSESGVGTETSAVERSAQGWQSPGFLGKFAIELKHGRTRRYICLSATVRHREKEVGIGLMPVTRRHEEELRQTVSEISGDYSSLPKWLRVAGAVTLLNPKEVRSLFLSNLIEMCRMNRLHLPWSTEETPIGCKEGSWGTEIHPEMEDILLRKLLHLHLVPNLVTHVTLENIYRHLEQFNRNVPIGGNRQRDRRAFTCLMKLLEQLKEYCVTQLHSPSNSMDSPVPQTELQAAILLALQRLLCTRGVFEEVPHSQYKTSIEVIMELLHSPMEEVSFAAANVLKYMVVNYSETRSMKSEAANRRAVFTKYHCYNFVSRIFDYSKQNRLGRAQFVRPTENSNTEHPTPWRHFIGIEQARISTNVTALQHSKSLTGALSFSVLGLDYLVISLGLQTLEVCLSSGKKATPERIVRELLDAMRIDEFSRHHAMFLYNRSLAFSIAKCSSILVKVHVLEQRSELVELIQDFARKHGALLWQLYLSLYGQDKAQRRISSQLVALLTHENPRSSSVIRRIFPHGLLDDLPLSQLEYDEFGRALPAISVDAIMKSTNGDRTAASAQASAAVTAASMQAQAVQGDVQAGVSTASSPRRATILGATSMAAAAAGSFVTAGNASSTAQINENSGSVDITNATESGRSKVIMYGINTRSRLAKSTKCVVLLPEFFDRLWQNFQAKDLIWGPQCVEELVRKLEAEFALLDVFRLKYYCYLYSDPLVAGNRHDLMYSPSFIAATDHLWNTTLKAHIFSVPEHYEYLLHTLAHPHTEAFLGSQNDSFSTCKNLDKTTVSSILSVCNTPFVFSEGRHHGFNMGTFRDHHRGLEMGATPLSSAAHRFAQYVPLAFILNPDTSDVAIQSDEEWPGNDQNCTSERRTNMNRSDSDNDSQDEQLNSRLVDRVQGSRSQDTTPPSSRSDIKKRQHLNRHTRNNQDRATTLEKNKSGKYTQSRTKRARRQVPRWFISWNGNEFQVDYECLQNEVRVGPYYLTNLLNDRGVLTENIDEPEKFMTLLYYRLLAEEGKFDTDPGSTDVDASDIRLLVLKVMIQLYERHYFELSSLMFLNHLLCVSMVGNRGQITGRTALGGEVEGSRKWPLVIRGNIVLFLDRVLSSAVNVARFLREAENVWIILELLHEVKPMLAIDTNTEEVYEGSSIAVDVVEEEEQVITTDEVVDDKYDEMEDSESLVEEVQEVNGASPQIDPISYEEGEPKLVPDIEEPSRFTVVAEHCGAMSGSMIMQACLSVLSRLIDCHTSEQEGSMYQDTRFPRHGRVTYFEGCGVSPISEIKRRLCEDQTLRFLVSLLDSQNRIVFKKTLGLLRLLVRHNEAAIPGLHATGLFYYLLRYAQDVDEMTVAARLISHIHLRQSKVNAKDWDQEISKPKAVDVTDGVFSPDPLTLICMRSWLVRLLPVSMVAQLLRHGPRRFAQALFSDSNNPEVVWNSNMRMQMVNYIEKFLACHMDAVTRLFLISEDTGQGHEVCTALIQYPLEVHALQCYQYYLHNLLDEDVFPDWPINDVSSFVQALLDSVHRWVQPPSFPSGNSASEAGTCRPVFVKDVILLLKAISLLLKRFPEADCLRRLQNISYVLDSLERCIVELHDNSKLSITPAWRKKSSNDTDIEDIPTKEVLVENFSSGILVINRALKLSDHNANECSSKLGLRVFCGALQVLYECGDTTETMAPNMATTTNQVLEALVVVLSLPNARASAGAQSLDFLPYLTRFLRVKSQDTIATGLSLRIVHEMAEGTGELAEVLPLQLAKHGVLWYLVLICLSYESIASTNSIIADEQNILDDSTEKNSTVSDDGKARNHNSIEAAMALHQILDANASDEAISMYVTRMQETIVTIFTRPLINILRSSGPIAFLEVLVSEVREPHVMWMDRMRSELISIAQEAVEFHSALDQNEEKVSRVFELPNHFIYSAQKEELCVAGIYVNFFNENPQKGVQAQIAGQDAPGLCNIPGLDSSNMSKISAKKVTSGLLGTSHKKTAASFPSAMEGVARSVSGQVMHGLLRAIMHDIAGVRAEPQCLEAVLLQRMLPIATAIRHLLQHTCDMDFQVLQSDGTAILLSILDHEAQPQAFSFSCAPLLQLRCLECLHILSFSGPCIDGLAASVPPYIKSTFQIVYHHLGKPDASTEGQLARITLQLLGNLCLVPACVDNLVLGMDPNELSNLLPQIYLGEPGEMQLLLCVHMIPLKRHTHAATQFAKAAVNSQLANALLNLLSLLVPKSKLGDSSLTKSYAARFLSVLSSNPGSGGAISSLLIASRAWETHGDTTQGSTEDLRRLLIPPHAPMMMKSDRANPHRIG
uniref:Uncharacterized protein AlNc14C237G9409 n=1 Tax=Albugo laibachii Nc14 TaxID=890382 RepID=F0WF15_9STRA|nr:conserved hypothetical protein [Albugo laibachii Nc14]CCA24391.1 conserved hypothetical protein [Albugo laibachii Nc14]|eukprot:CCA24391.1 conserved hypothetical protein [Albugo laibachii Nc14]